MNKRLPASDWRSRSINDWNTTTFTKYLEDRHRELFGVDYVPYRSWRVEQGLIANIIGTTTGSKPQKYPPEVLRSFIDECFADYRPSAKYPGISFGFMWTYRKNVWQRVIAEYEREEQRKVVEENRPSDEEIRAWF